MSRWGETLRAQQVRKHLLPAEFTTFELKAAASQGMLGDFAVTAGPPSPTPTVLPSPGAGSILSAQGLPSLAT